VRENNILDVWELFEKFDEKYFCCRKFYEIVAKRMNYAPESEIPELKSMILSGGDFNEQEVDVLRYTIQMLIQVLPIFEPEYSVDKFKLIVKALA
jgi:hypothetical protein